MAKEKWEIVDAHEKVCGGDFEEVTTKMKVEGGWLYYHRTTILLSRVMTESMCFVPEQCATKPQPEQPFEATTLERA